MIALLGGGWLIGIAWVPWQGERRVPGGGRRRDQSEGKHRYSAWDIQCGTTFVALICWVWPRVENQFDLICQVAPALLGGWILSLLAMRWAWCDRWTVSGAVGILFQLSIVGLLALPWGRIETDFRSLALWVVSGPLSVMASQSLVVLLWLASLRCQLPSLASDDACQPQSLQV